VFGSRARELSVSTGSENETTTVIGKMSAEEIAGMNRIGVLRSLQRHHDQTLIETGTIEAEIGNAPIARGHIVIDPTIVSGNPALLGRQSPATETGTLKIEQIGNARTTEIPTVIDRTRPGSATHPNRQSRVIETARTGIEKIGSGLIAGAPNPSVQIALRSPARRHRKYRAFETVTTRIKKAGSALIVALQIVTDQIESGDPAPQTRKHGRITKVSSETNAELGEGMAMKAKELP
jgi:hypothetical protein